MWLHVGWNSQRSYSKRFSSVSGKPRSSHSRGRYLWSNNPVHRRPIILWNFQSKTSFFSNQNPISSVQNHIRRPTVMILQEWHVAHQMKWTSGFNVTVGGSRACRTKYAVTCFIIRYYTYIHEHIGTWYETYIWRIYSIDSMFHTKS